MAIERNLEECTMLEMLNIRLAQPKDHSAIVDIWHSGWHEAHANLVPNGILKFRTVECFWVWLKCSNDKFYVALNDGVVGFVATNQTELVKLYVDTGARGNGTATALLSYAEAQMSNDGIQGAFLFCTAGNTRAQRFYSRENWILSETFADRLWLPENTAVEFIVDTHRYEKHLK